MSAGYIWAPENRRYFPIGSFFRRPRPPRMLANTCPITCEVEPLPYEPNPTRPGFALSSHSVGTMRRNHAQSPADPLAPRVINRSSCLPSNTELTQTMRAVENVRCRAAF